MRFVRRHRYVLSFLALLVFCSVMILRQLDAKRARVEQMKARHIELREAFILLYIRGYKPEAEKLYGKLINDAWKQETTTLIDDFNRTLLLIDPLSQQTNNLIYKYHWTVSKELDTRSESTLERALKLAGETNAAAEVKNER